MKPENKTIKDQVLERHFGTTTFEWLKDSPPDEISIGDIFDCIDLTEKLVRKERLQLHDACSICNKRIDMITPIVCEDCYKEHIKTHREEVRKECAKKSNEMIFKLAKDYEQARADAENKIFAEIEKGLPEMEFMIDDVGHEKEKIGVVYTHTIRHRLENLKQKVLK